MTGGVLRNSTVCSDWGDRDNGGVYMTGGLVENCAIARNKLTSNAQNGGGLYMTGGTVVNSTISENTNVNSRGGGIFMDHGGLVRNCCVAGNSSQHYGGGDAARR